MNLTNMRITQIMFKGLKTTITHEWNYKHFPESIRRETTEWIKITPHMRLRKEKITCPPLHYKELIYRLEIDYFIYFVNGVVENKKQIITRPTLKAINGVLDIILTSYSIYKEELTIANSNLYELQRTDWSKFL